MIKHHELWPDTPATSAQDLGALAPRDNRRVPVLMVGTKPLEDQDLGAAGLAAHALSSVSVHVPPLRERTVASRLHSLLLRLPPSYCTPAALHALSRHAWWGNLGSMDAVITRLLSDTPP